MKLIRKNSGQTNLVFVLVTAAVMLMLGLSMATLLRHQQLQLVSQSCIMQKQQLASIALEQTIYKLQQENNWFNVGQSPMANYSGYTHQFEIPTGYFTIHIASGNLFLDKSNTYSSGQAKNEYKTIGIKVKTKVTNCTGNFYAVVKKMKFGGPLVSKGKIDLPCVQPANLVNPMPLRANFYWGDIYSANTITGYCKISDIDVGYGSYGDREKWLPQVYARGDIYTHVYNAPGTGNWIFDYTYYDMSPTAHCHPYSEFAIAPDIDFDWYKDQAKKQGSYYGPDVGPGTAFVTQANVVTIMSKLKSQDSVLYIDTTDGLPVRTTPTCNTYAGYVTCSANTLTFYVSATNQYLTQGTCIVKGPLRLIGDTPGNIANRAGFTWNYGGVTGTVSDQVKKQAPDNFYFPQTTDGYHYIYDSNVAANTKLTKVKHSGLMYVNGELRIGGPRTNSTTSNICIYGTIYIGENGVLKFDNTNDTPYLYVYYNTDLNLFGTTGNTISVISFNEASFLMPRPDASPFNNNYPNF